MKLHGDSQEISLLLDSVHMLGIMSVMKNEGWEWIPRIYSPSRATHGVKFSSAVQLKASWPLHRVATIYELAGGR